MAMNDWFSSASVCASEGEPTHPQTTWQWSHPPCKHLIAALYIGPSGLDVGRYLLYSHDACLRVVRVGFIDPKWFARRGGRPETDDLVTVAFYDGTGGGRLVPIDRKRIILEAPAINSPMWQVGP